MEKVRGLFSAFPAFQLSEDRQMIYWAFPSLSFTIGSQAEKKGANFKKMCGWFGGVGRIPVYYLSEKRKPSNSSDSDPEAYDL